MGMAESSDLLGHKPEAVTAILANAETGFFAIPLQLSRSAAEISVILRKYRDTRAGFADACLMQMVDELNSSGILTLDRDFKHCRWGRNRRFRPLIPRE